MDTDLIPSRGRKLASADVVKAFVLAGNATFTIKSLRTGTRFTYKVRQCEDNKHFHFVSLLSGSNNEADYQYLGTINWYGYKRGVKSRIGDTAPSHLAFQWFWARIASDQLPDTVECWHEGKCGRCGRTLTVPESIERGIGPECATYM